MICVHRYKSKRILGCLYFRFTSVIICWPLKFTDLVIPHQLLRVEETKTVPPSGNHHEIFQNGHYWYITKVEQPCCVLFALFCSVRVVAGLFIRVGFVLIIQQHWTSMSAHSLWVLFVKKNFFFWPTLLQSVGFKKMFSFIYNWYLNSHSKLDDWIEKFDL